MNYDEVFEILCIEDGEGDTPILQAWSEDREKANYICGRELMTLAHNDYYVARTTYEENRHTPELYLRKSFFPD